VRRLDATFLQTGSPGVANQRACDNVWGIRATVCEMIVMSSSENDNPFPEPVEIEITDVFDLHTIPPRQVKAVVEEYLREARARGFRVVRIIHGKGRGVQREVVRSVLARTEFVLDWTDAPPDAGGLGATIVRLLKIK
jgi:dsDNA-specific endonuclease/ATPase MutS2